MKEKKKEKERRKITFQKTRILNVAGGGDLRHENGMVVNSYYNYGNKKLIIHNDDDEDTYFLFFVLKDRSID